SNIRFRIRTNCIVSRITFSNSNTRFKYEKTGLENRKLPNVISVIDEVHIPIHKPSENNACYVNQKNFTLSTFLELLIIRDILSIYILMK
ncbi:10114_t:CDS:1, partial [Funneliformis caledonium]